MVVLLATGLLNAKRKINELRVAIIPDKIIVKGDQENGLSGKGSSEANSHLSLESIQNNSSYYN